MIYGLREVRESLLYLEACGKNGDTEDWATHPCLRL